MTASGSSISASSRPRARGASWWPSSGSTTASRFRAPGTSSEPIAACEALGAVRAASANNGGIALIVDGARTILPELLSTASGAGLAISSVEVDEPDLEAVFLHLTGKALRD